MRAKYGKHTLYLGSSHLAQSSAQHGADRGDEPLRKRVLLKGETTRRRLGIPMFMGCSSIPVFEHFEGVIGLVVPQRHIHRVHPSDQFLDVLAEVRHGTGGN